MSRHEITAKHPDHQVIVGWDNPLSTYFAIVSRPNAEDEESVVLWLGGSRGEYLRAQDMVDPLKPFADLTPEMIQKLRNDRAATLDQGPTPLQRMRFA